MRNIPDYSLHTGTDRNESAKVDDNFGTENLVQSLLPPEEREINKNQAHSSVALR
jgi:hypothetical protein